LKNNLSKKDNISLHLDISIHHHYSEVSSFWNNELPAQSELQLPEIGIVEDACIADIKHCYIVVKQDNKIIAQLYAQVLQVRPKYIVGNNLSKGMQLLSKYTLNCFSVKLLVLGNLFRHDGSFIFIKDEKNKLQILENIVAFLQQKIKHTAFFIKDIQEEYAVVFQNKKEYNTFPNDFSMQLGIRKNWLQFSDYVDDLTKKYRQRVTKTQAAFTEVQVKKLELQDVIIEKENMFKLYEQVTQKQSITLGLLNGNYFELLKQNMGENLHVYGFYFKNKLVAFSTSIVHDGIYDMNYIGFDYELNNSLHLYFNMLFCFIEKAIEANCTSLVMGRTALEAKAILGCTAHPVFGFYKIKNSILNNVAIRFAKNTTTIQGEAWRDRHPFKN
jgi:Peptidogalycan biosysnthesis/recognition